MIHGVVLGWMVMVRILKIDTIIQGPHLLLLHTGIMWITTRPTHLLIQIYKFFWSILLLCTLMKITLMSNATIVRLLKCFHAHGLDNALDCGSRTGDLIHRRSLRSLRRTRPYWACSRLIVNKPMIKLSMRFQNTLRSLVHFFDILIHMLNPFISLI